MDADPFGLFVKLVSLGRLDLTIDLVAEGPGSLAVRKGNLLQAVHPRILHLQPMHFTSYLILLAGSIFETDFFQFDWASGGQDFFWSEGVQVVLSVDYRGQLERH